ncbi:hypothetical protein K402DRAFT_449299 [Aulographum hederae CBS 113979]|uniref:F-box domain-containing protein n=1 Tax=Aulographum hederae CBS 113979 TaxID=1176131 RepID=A0A6G1GJW7_9PEZI|nr:hypothetical protein K402DRAFT_449299 [Aulographum hederae CBS 113979]
MNPTVNIDSLANELLLHVFSYLNVLEAEPPSLTKFHEEPVTASTKYLTEADEKPLKALTTVSRRWRVLLLPYLFRYARLRLNGGSRWVRITQNLEKSLQGRPGRSEHENDILKQIAGYEEDNVDATSRNKTRDIQWMEDDDKILLGLCADQRTWIPTSHGYPTAFLKFVVDNEITDKVKSLVVYTTHELAVDVGDTPSDVLCREVTRFWKTLFVTIDPYRIVVAAPPASMSALVQSRMETDDAWAFEMPWHYLELSRPEPKKGKGKEEDQEKPEPPLPSCPSTHQMCLSNIRKWTHIGYNEGTSLPVYSSYEYQWKTAPKILYYLLFFMSKNPQTAGSPRLESLSYTSIFPLADHFSQMRHLLLKFPSLTNLRVQLAPNPDSMILEERRGTADVNDLWAEWGMAYRGLAKFLGTHDGLQKVEILDYRTTDLMWKLNSLLVQNNRGASWKKSGEAWMKKRTT